MPFLQLTFDVGAADPTCLEEALLELGALSITLEDAGDDPVLEPAPGATPLWPTVRLKALFPAHTHVPHVLATLRATYGVPPLSPHVEHIADRAWEREWLKDFRPMRFGQRLWICPGGQHPTELTEQSNARIVELDPGLAFGTGTHATTALCLEWLDGADLSGASVIDYGCGSGVLGIAALKLGAREVLAVDVDPQALTATRDNALRNGVAMQVRTFLPQELPKAQADVLVANILAEPLVQLAPVLADLSIDHGRLVLSGLLAEQVPAVAAAYAAWFDIRPAALRDTWARLEALRRPR